MSNNVSTFKVTNADSFGGFAYIHDTDKVSFFQAVTQVGKSVLKSLCSAYLGLAHKISLCSVALFSIIILLNLSVSVPSLIVIAGSVIFNTIVSFFLIYNEVKKEE